MVCACLSVTIATHRKQEETGTKRESTRATAQDRSDCRSDNRKDRRPPGMGAATLAPQRGLDQAGEDRGQWGHLLAVGLEDASAWSFWSPEGASNSLQVLMVEASQGPLGCHLYSKF